MEKTCRNCKYFKPGFAGFFCLASGAGGCISNSLWEPKEEVTVEKLYTTGQMIDMLLENPKRRATDEGEDVIVSFLGNHNSLWVESSDNEFWISTIDVNRKWRIIEPEPQKVSFAEAFKAYHKCKTLKSNLTKALYSACSDNEHLFLGVATDEEIDSDWIILD